MTDEPRDCDGRVLKIGDWVTIQPVPGGFRAVYSLDARRDDGVGLRFEIVRFDHRNLAGNPHYMVSCDNHVAGYERWPAPALKADGQGLKGLVARYKMEGTRT